MEERYKQLISFSKIQMMPLGSGYPSPTPKKKNCALTSDNTEEW